MITFVEIYGASTQWDPFVTTTVKIVGKNSGSV